ncbi:A/G-specific adenine glycosylase [bacterium]|nr:A/G-specific adenine glycosylase [bacterium]
MIEDRLQLIEWFLSVQRDFPWRKNRLPYTVLVSEIMLQQTKAVAVLPYFSRWMEQFPDFSALARATEEEVMKAWEGLGYYSRARNLRNIAIEVMQQFNGEFPSDYEEILSFKGIGSYTAAAISHFAFGKRAVGADGNIKKVMARYFGYEGRIDRGNEILLLLDQFLPKVCDANVFEGLIELGATVCSKKPDCEKCPLQAGCKAFLEGKTEKIPLLKKREKTVQLQRVVFLLERDGAILIKKEEKKLMKGLHEFPYLEEGRVDIAVEKMQSHFLVPLKVEKKFEQVVHTFTKYKATLLPVICQVEKNFSPPPGCFFLSYSRLADYPFSSGHRKIADRYVLHKSCN